MSQAVSSRPELRIAVFGKGTRTNGIPAYCTDEESAAYLVDVLRIAKWVNRRYKSIIMLVEPGLAKLRDMSCSMGGNVAHLAAAGSKYHQALVDGWKPRLRIVMEGVEHFYHVNLTDEIETQEIEQFELEAA